MPKSMIFRPPVASMMMFCGLMSRWMTPTSCAAARPAQICLAMRRPDGRRQDVARLDELLQREPLDELHREVAQAARLAEVVRAQDVRVRDPAREADLLLEPVEQRRVRGERLAAQRLDRDARRRGRGRARGRRRPCRPARGRPGSRSARRRAGRPAARRPRRCAGEAPARIATRLGARRPSFRFSDATYCSSAAFSLSSSSIARKERARMPISSFDSTGRSGASRLPTRTCSVAATSRPTGPGDPPREEEGEDERDDERGEARRGSACSGSAGTARAPARGCAARRPRRRAGRWRSGSAGSRRGTSRPTTSSGERADRLALAQHGLRRGRCAASIAASRGAAERSHRRGGERRLRPAPPASPRRRGRRPACSGAARGCARPRR